MGIMEKNVSMKKHFRKWGRDECRCPLGIDLQVQKANEQKHSS